MTRRPQMSRTNQKQWHAAILAGVRKGVVPRQLHRVAYAITKARGWAQVSAVANELRLTEAQVLDCIHALIEAGFYDLRDNGRLRQSMPAEPEQAAA